jgi:alkylation response protein AidB-like acyl-CoA dehydrogenase
MTYRAPVTDIAFTLKHSAGFGKALENGLYDDLDAATVEAVLEEAGKFAGDVIAPLNRIGDTFGTPFKDGAVTTPPGWKDAYTSWAAAGWNGLASPADFGGQDLPQAVNAACIEMWNSASMAFGIGPVLTMAAIDALHDFGSDDLKKNYLAQLVSGKWMGTMQLTEPQAGSDVGALRTKAERADDGTYRITGQKIFITYGEHDLTANIIHFVLARLPDAPAGTKGISLFLVPKILPDGSRNNVRAHSVEHKMGIHASPTCTMVYGDNGGAIGWLIGKENEGMRCMFTMMNRARLAVGLSGVAIAERATQQALAYARDRKQGNSTIIGYPDVKRMLLTMRALTHAARTICYATAVALDRSQRSKTEAARKAGDERASLLTPVAKAFSTDVGIEVASLGATGARLGETVESLSRATQWLVAQKSSDGALAGATPYLRLFGTAAGGCMMAEDALASLRDGSAGASRVALARFFAENLAVQAQGIEREVIDGAESVTNGEAALA